MTRSASDIIDTLTYVREFSGQSILVKLGGSALKDISLVKALCADLSLIRSIGISVVIVHGGGPSISDELTLRGIKSEFYEGQRITSSEMIDVIEMVLCGKINRRIVRTLNASGIRAIGLSGTDANMILCRKDTSNNSKLQNVGVIERVDADFVGHYLKKEGTQAIIPVVAPLGIDEKGLALNVNADWAACHIALALNIKKIIYLSDQDGILDHEGQTIPYVYPDELEDLVEKKVVTGGMLAKTKTILYAIKNGAQEVNIINSKRPHSIIEELFTVKGVGTVCRPRKET